MIPQHLPINTADVTDIGYPQFIIVQQKGCRRRVKSLARSSLAAPQMQMVHTGSDHQHSGNGLEGTSGIILSIFLPQSSINGQGQAMLMLNSYRGARLLEGKQGAQWLWKEPRPSSLAWSPQIHHLL